MTTNRSRPSYEELTAENASLRQRIADLALQVAENTLLRQRDAELEQQIVELKAALKTALEQLEAARRAGKRQAAPFSKGPPRDNPKSSRPGVSGVDGAPRLAMPSRPRMLWERLRCRLAPRPWLWLPN